MVPPEFCPEFEVHQQLHNGLQVLEKRQTRIQKMSY
jgi:hypothetical protein